MGGAGPSRLGPQVTDRVEAAAEAQDFRPEGSHPDGEEPAAEGRDDDVEGSGGAGTRWIPVVSGRGEPQWDSHGRTVVKPGPPALPGQGWHPPRRGLRLRVAWGGHVDPRHASWRLLPRVRRAA
jgi:hypothetical protein